MDLFSKLEMKSLGNYRLESKTFSFLSTLFKHWIPLLFILLLFNALLIHFNLYYYLPQGIYEFSSAGLYQSFSKGWATYLGSS